MKSRSLEEKKKYYFTTATFGNRSYASVCATLKSARVHTECSNVNLATLQEVSLSIVHPLFKGEPIFMIEPDNGYFLKSELLGTVAYSTRVEPGDVVIDKPTHGIT